MNVRKPVLVNVKKHILLLCVAFILSSCATRIDSVPRIMLSDDIGYVLQPIPESLINTGIQALFTVKQQNTEKQFLIQVEMAQSHILVSGMTVEGLSLFTLDWHTQSNTLDFDNKMAIDPLRVLAELQLVLWPVADISQGLEQAKVTLIAENQREISSLNEVVYQINEQGSISTLVNIKQSYSLVIEELDRWQLSEEKAGN
jgi:hypothetical protein